MRLGPENIALADHARLYIAFDSAKLGFKMLFVEARFAAINLGNLYQLGIQLRRTLTVPVEVRLALFQ